MTRLRTEDIKAISAQLKQYDRELIRKTGRTLCGIACHALGLEEEEFHSLAALVPVAVIPVRSGQGVITGFSPTVRDIVAHIGFNAFVTRAADVAGIAEAVKKGAEVIMMADDLRFVALRLKTGLIVDSSEATAKGFVAGLDLMAGGIQQQKVLVIGCGPVGRSAVSAALQRGAQVSVFDIDIRRSQTLAGDIHKLTGKTVTVEESINRGSGTVCRGFDRFDFMVEATNAAFVIHEADITSRTYIAAPGMPFGLTPAAAREVSGRLLHDPLQLGVSVMAAEAVKRF